MQYRILGMIIIITSGIYWVGIYRFHNPHLTETQLFLNKWYLLIPIIIGFLLTKRR